MFGNRRAMICASFLAIALCTTGCKKAITSTIFVENATTNVTILSINAEAGNVRFVYTGNLLPGSGVGPIRRKTVANRGDHAPITGTVVASVLGVRREFPIPPIANDFRVGRTNTITFTGTYLIGAPGEIVAVNVDTP